MTILGPTFFILAIACWVIGGNWVVGRCHLRNGRSPTHDVGLKTGQVFRDFTRQDWLLFLLFAALFVIFLALAAAFGFFS